jgi:ribosomal protein L37AE/L43A
MKSAVKGKTASKKGVSKSPGATLTPTVILTKAPGEIKPKAKRGVKTSSHQLSRVIEMANLANSYEREHGRESIYWRLFTYGDFGDKDRVQDANDLLSAIMRLHDSRLRSHLLEVMNDPGEWTERATDYLDGFKPEYATLYRRARAVLERYHFILGACNALEHIVYGHDSIPVRVGIDRYVNGQGKHKPRYTTDVIGQALMSVDDLRDIRRCAVCEKFFFARRFSSAVCDPDSTCASTYAKREERKNKKLREKLAKRKTKRATPAPKR